MTHFLSELAFKVLMFLADYRSWISAIGCIHIAMQIKHFLWALCCFRPCDA